MTEQDQAGNAEKKQLADVIAKIDQWGRDRNIIGGATSAAQFLKLTEEFGEIVEAEDADSAKDGIGDTVVVATMIAGIEGLTLEPQTSSGGYRFDELVHRGAILFGRLAAAIARKNTEEIKTSLERLMILMEDWASYEKVTLSACAEHAYNEIKDRKGVMLEGVLIKSSDPKYKDALTRLGRTE